MTKSIDRTTSLVLRLIGEEDINYLNEYASEVLNRQFIEFKNHNQIMEFFKKNLEYLYSNCTLEDIEILRYYTGIAYREINAILRNNWSYETNGPLTEEKRSYYNELSNKVKNAIDKNYQLPSNIVTYRGVSLDSFKKFGINSLQDIPSLKNQFIYDTGFTSTSLIRDKSFFNRNLEWHNNCNIEIQYLIPEETEEAVPLLNEDMSYSTIQAEYLINKGSLSKVIDVTLDEKQNIAYIKMVYIPQKIWDKTRNRDIKQTTSRR
ncbi:MAG: hypothetical protein IJ509_00370 [Bacilli bacterium]|nr:hypothetical protein [Bacilli bacterium]